MYSEDVEEPVKDVEDDEGDGEDDARVAIDLRKVLDLGDHFDRPSGCLPEDMHDSPLLPLTTTSGGTPSPGKVARVKVRGVRVAMSRMRGWQWVSARVCR